MQQWSLAKKNAHPANRATTGPFINYSKKIRGIFTVSSVLFNFKGIVQPYRTYAYLLSCQVIDQKINTTLVSVQ